ncbi:hypothetical protein OG394_19595 [Kribbella sp. NBC_01245]|uniref:hypothetical protein n=1 Tax=Kribbella sp. NBC_01245 TaxID=2903578 RepID=UPI002E2C93E9|nr:hypothetical protein [Kribbella sp. NBC_01245]
MHDYDSHGWQRLGRLVRAARVKAGYGESREWSARVGRSTRMLLGLERGEPVGDATLARVAESLGWPIERIYDTLGETSASTKTQQELVAEMPVLDVEHALEKVTEEIETLKTLLAAAEASRGILAGRIEQQRQATRLLRDGRSPELFIAERELRFHQESLVGFDRHFGPPRSQSKELRQQRRRFVDAVEQAQQKLAEVQAAGKASEKASS